MRSAVGLDQMHQEPGDRRFAAAAFPDDREHLARVQRRSSRHRQRARARLVRPSRPPWTGNDLLRCRDLEQRAGPARPRGSHAQSAGLIDRSDVERLAKPVAHEIEAQGRHEDHRARQSGVDRRDIDRLTQRAQHRAPFRLRRRHAQTEKRQAGGQDDGEADQAGCVDQYRTEDIAEHVPRQDREVEAPLARAAST